MDINKLKEAENLHYSKKELQLIYWQAQARDIKKKELKDIKKALYEIIDLGQPSSTFINLLKTLKCLPDKALKSIENGEFTNIYIKLKNKERNEQGPFYKGDFHHCINLLLLLYTDYSNINSKQEFDLISSSFIEQIYIDNNEELINMIFNINPHLSYIIEDYKRYKNITKNKKSNIFDNTPNKLDNIYRNLQVTLLMHINIFNYKYNLPTDIIQFLYDNIELTSKTILKSYNNCEDKYKFTKILLIEYLILKNKTENLPSISSEELNHKIKKLLKD